MARKLFSRWRRYLVESIEYLFADDIVRLFEWFTLFWGQVLVGKLECVAPASNQMLAKYIFDLHVNVPTF